MVVAYGTNSFAKEMAIRKRIASIFNKRDDDFPSLREYNDYLEEVEDMTCNLIKGIDVPSIEAKIAEYQKENSEQIMNAQARKAEEYAAALAASKGQPVQANIDATTSSQGGVDAGVQGHYAPAIAGSAIAQPRPMGMGPQPIPIGYNPDTQTYDFDDEEMMRLRAERGGRAGGWSAELSRKREFEEAFSSIWI
ncbi:CDK-activating kinase assembly factor like [Actinidia chinensis var. chinensis]|uniref:CDK-activating kinase assembly factor like n=1 Tax=Actinidia chinensis var. chinensis TaxID=1590841 RepID=A0A2R6QIC3_ACTCC|nr:CDK-activating kinase assembly factor like [Actinidia chinensis var. chinensis]